MVRSALHNAEETWFSVIAARISPGATARVLALIDGGTASDGEEDEEEDEDEDAAEDQDSVLALVKAQDSYSYGEPQSSAMHLCARALLPIFAKAG